jgi:hypothetical protein
VKRKRIARHNRILHETLIAVQTGRQGGWWLTGDAIGFSLEEQLSAARQPETDTTLPHAETQDSLHIDHRQHKHALLGSDTSDDSDTEDEYKPTTDEDSDGLETTIVPPTAPLTRLLNTPVQRAIARVLDPNPNEQTRETRTIVPPDWNYTGTRKPDGLLIQNRRLIGPSPPAAEQHVHFFDVTVASENAIADAVTRKLTQYIELMDHAAGIGLKASLHVIVVGCRGFMPHHTHAALTDLGIRPNAKWKLEVKSCRIARETAVGLVWTRRHLESELPNKEQISGAHRELTFRRLKSKLKRQDPSSTERPPG